MNGEKKQLLVKTLVGILVIGLIVGFFVYKGKKQNEDDLSSAIQMVKEQNEENRENYSTYSNIDTTIAIENTTSKSTKEDETKISIDELVLEYDISSICDAVCEGSNEDDIYLLKKDETSADIIYFLDTEDRKDMVFFAIQKSVLYSVLEWQKDFDFLYFNFYDTNSKQPIAKYGIINPFDEFSDFGAGVIWLDEYKDLGEEFVGGGYQDSLFGHDQS